MANCGTGDGGFKEGNTCGKKRSGGRKSGARVDHDPEFLDFLTGVELIESAPTVASAKMKLDQAIEEASLENELDPEELRKVAEEIWEFHRDYDRHREDIKKDVRKTMGLNRNDVSQIENGYRDFSTIPNFDLLTTGIVEQYPELGLDAEEPSAGVWALLSEGVRETKPKFHPDIIREAVESMNSSRSFVHAGSVEDDAEWLTRSLRSSFASIFKNCGTGDGGFKPGNSCGKKGGPRSATVDSGKSGKRAESAKYSQESLSSSIDDWMKRHKIGSEKWTRARGLATVPGPDVLAKISADQDAHTGVAPDKATLASYASLRTVLGSQFEAVKKSGLKIRAWKGEGEPYKASPEKLWVPSSDEMRKRVGETGEFFFFMTDVGFGADGGAKEGQKHPLLEKSPYKTDDGEAMVWNDVFRVVHDAVGHLSAGFSFSGQGEFNAMLAHMSTLPESAKAALFAETFAQTSYYETHKKYANQNVFSSRYMNEILAYARKSQGSASAAVTKSFSAKSVSGGDSDEPVGFGRLKRQNRTDSGVAGEDEYLSFLVTKSLDSLVLPEFGHVIKASGTDCGRDDGGKFGQKNRCQKEGSGNGSSPSGASSGRQRVMFEAAPDPNDEALTNRWRKLSDGDRLAVSRKIVNEIMPSVSEAIGVEMEVSDQLGGYLDDTNPSFCASFPDNVDPAKFVESMKLAGFVLSQDSMMGISMSQIPGSEKAGFISVTIPDGQDVHGLYEKIREMDGRVQGHTTVGNQMTIVDFTGDHEQIAEMIMDEIDVDVNVSEGYAVFVAKDQYGYESGSTKKEENTRKGDSADSPGRGSGDDLRSKATGIIERELSAIERRGKGGNTIASKGLSGRLSSAFSVVFAKEFDENRHRRDKGGRFTYGSNGPVMERSHLESGEQAAGEKTKASGEGQKTEAKVSMRRVQKVIDDSEKIGWTDDLHDDSTEGSDFYSLSSEFDSVLTEKYVTENDSEAESQLISDMSDAASSAAEESWDEHNSHNPVEVDEEEVASSAGYSNLGVNNKLLKEFSDNEEFREVVSSWYGESSSAGEDAFNEIKEKASEMEVEIPEGFESFRDTAMDAINDSRDSLVSEREEYDKESYIEDYTSSFDDSDDRMEWLKDYWERNLKGQIPSERMANVPRDEWFDGSYGKTLVFDTDSGWYEINVQQKSSSMGTVHDVTFNDSNNSYQRTGKVGAATALRVMDKVTASMLSYIDNQDEPSSYTFTAESEARQNVYERMVKTVAKIKGEYVAFAVWQGHNKDQKTFAIVPRSESESVVSFLKAKFGESTVVDQFVKSFRVKRVLPVMAKRCVGASYSDVYRWLTDVSVW